MIAPKHLKIQLMNVIKLDGKNLKDRMINMINKPGYKNLKLDELKQNELSMVISWYKQKAISLLIGYRNEDGETTIKDRVENERE